MAELGQLYPPRNSDEVAVTVELSWNDLAYSSIALDQLVHRDENVTPEVKKTREKFDRIYRNVHSLKRDGVKSL